MKVKFIERAVITTALLTLFNSISVAKNLVVEVQDSCPETTKYSTKLSWPKFIDLMKSGDCYSFEFFEGKHIKAICGKNKQQPFGLAFKEATIEKHNEAEAAYIESGAKRVDARTKKPSLTEKTISWSEFFNQHVKTGDCYSAKIQGSEVEATCGKNTGDVTVINTHNKKGSTDTCSQIEPFGVNTIIYK